MGVGGRGLQVGGVWSGDRSKMAAWRQAISKNLREVRIHLCQTCESSKGVRQVIFVFFAVACKPTLHSCDI